MKLSEYLRVVYTKNSFTEVSIREIQGCIPLAEHRSVVNDFYEFLQLIYVKDKAEDEVAAEQEAHDKVHTHYLEAPLAVTPVS